MFFQQNKTNYFLSDQEKQDLASLFILPWKRIYVQSGKIERIYEPYVYSIGGIVIETNYKFMITLISKDICDGSEIFKISITSNQKNIQEQIRWWYPKIRKLVDIPKDLEIESFIGIKNNYNLLQFSEFFTHKNSKNILKVDSGLLIENDNHRLLLYPNEEIPLDFCITTNKEKIEHILNRVKSLSLNN